MKPVIIIPAALAVTLTAFLVNDQKQPEQTDLAKVVFMQEEAVKQYGRPIQVKDDVASEIVEEQLIGEKLPPNVRVDVYETKKGWGYQAIEYGTTTINGRTFRQWRSFGTGPEAESRTWDWTTIDEYIASST